jgi:hypothetical protein
MYLDFIIAKKKITIENITINTKDELDKFWTERIKKSNY